MFKYVEKNFYDYLEYFSCVVSLEKQHVSCITCLIRKANKKKQQKYLHIMPLNAVQLAGADGVHILRQGRQHSWPLALRTFINSREQ